MTHTQPRVYLIASTHLHRDEASTWLQSIGVSEDRAKPLVSDERHYDLEVCSGPDPVDGAERLIELAARRCYKSFEVGLNPNITKVREDSADYLRNILKSGHGSVLEHSSATFAIEYCSRVFTHELVRHRAGTAFSQESLRYVRLTDMGFRIPNDVDLGEESRMAIQEAIEYLEEKQKLLAWLTKIKDKSFAEKKVLTSAFRRIAPMGLSTGIVFTANFRALRHIIELRTSIGAEEEMRLIMNMIAIICQETWPLIFGDFYQSEEGEWRTEFSKV